MKIVRGAIEVSSKEDQQDGLKDLIEYLKQHHVTVDGGVAVEVGVWLGATSHELADHFNTVYCVDHWIGDQWTPNAYDVFLQNKTSNMIPIRIVSIAAVQRFEDKSLDFVYIDADHNGTQVAQDIYIWLPKLKSGGAIAGHDYGRGDETLGPARFDFSGLTHAVNSLLVTPDMVFKDTSWVKLLNK